MNAASHTECTEGDIMKPISPNQVLNEFLKGCCFGSDVGVDLASNGVLEWFGRTFRGCEKVHTFFRNDIRLNQHHQFSRAEEIDPFETKPAQKETLEDPPENLAEFVAVDPEESTLTTPPNSYFLAAQPPPLTRGRRFKPVDSQNASEADTPTSIHDLSGIHELATPPKCVPLPRRTARRKLGIESLPITESTSPHKAAKRKTLMADQAEATSPKILRSKDTSSPNRSNFSKLFYIEAIGVLRQNRGTKHRGVNLATPLNSSEPSTWDRDVRLRISYRLCHGSQSPQFALIVYEHLTRNPKTRRNLMEEFQSSDEEDSSIDQNGAIVTKIPSTTTSLDQQCEVSSASPETSTPQKILIDTPHTGASDHKSSSKSKTKKKTPSSTKKSTLLKRLRF